MRKPMAVIGFVWILMQWISVVTGHRYALVASVGFAAVGIVFSIMAMIQALGFTLGMGSGNCISRTLGSRDDENCRRTI